MKKPVKKLAKAQAGKVMKTTDDSSYTKPVQLSSKYAGKSVKQILKEARAKELMEKYGPPVQLSNRTEQPKAKKTKSDTAIYKKAYDSSSYKKGGSVGSKKKIIKKK